MNLPREEQDHRLQKLGRNPLIHRQFIGMVVCCITVDWSTRQLDYIAARQLKAR